MTWRRVVLAAVLVLAACGGGGDDDGADRSDRSTTEPPAGSSGSTTIGGPTEPEGPVGPECGAAPAAGEGLASGDGYSVAAALAEVPASATGDDAALARVTTADVAAATEQLGLERPADLSAEAVLDWWGPLSGSGEDGEDAPLVVTAPEVVNVQYLAEIEEFDAAVGWSLVDVDAFVEVLAPPLSFTVVAGAVEGALRADGLEPLSGCLVSLGGGEDFERADPTPLSRIGVPVRMGRRGDHLAAATGTPEIEAWRDGGGETLADDEGFAGVAGALDGAEVVSAVLRRAPGGGGAGEGDEGGPVVVAPPVDTVGVGWSAPGGEAAMAVAYHVAAGADVERVRDEIERTFTEGTSFRTRIPLADVFSLEGVSVEGAVVTVHLGAEDPRAPWVLRSMFDEGDAPFP